MPLAISGGRLLIKAASLLTQCSCCKGDPCGGCKLPSAVTVSFGQVDAPPLVVGQFSREFCSPAMANLFDEADFALTYAGIYWQNASNDAVAHQYVFRQDVGTTPGQLKYVQVTVILVCSRGTVYLWQVAITGEFNKPLTAGINEYCTCEGVWTDQAFQIVNGSLLVVATPSTVGTGFPCGTYTDTGTFSPNRYLGYQGDSTKGGIIARTFSVNDTLWLHDVRVYA